jgi:hypothetical protein
MYIMDTLSLPFLGIRKSPQGRMCGKGFYSNGWDPLTARRLRRWAAARNVEGSSPGHRFFLGILSERRQSRRTRWASRRAGHPVYRFWGHNETREDSESRPWCWFCYFSPDGIEHKIWCHSKPMPRRGFRQFHSIFFRSAILIPRVKTIDFGKEMK